MSKLTANEIEKIGGGPVEFPSGATENGKPFGLAENEVFFTATKAAADSLAAGLGDGATVIVDRDETNGDARVRYTVSSGLPTSPVVIFAELPTVAALVAAEGLFVGKIVSTLGYYAAGDGGANHYEIVAAATGTADGGSFIDLVGISGQAKGLFLDAEIRASQFGASISVDSSARLKSMWEFAAGRKSRIDVSVRSELKIDLVDTDVDCVIDDAVTISAENLPAGTALGQQYFLKVSGSITDSSSVTSDVEPFGENRTLTNEDSFVVVTDGSKFTAGDIVVLRSNQLFDDAWTGASSNKRGEMLMVKSVSANTVFFHDKIKFSYLASESAVLEKTNPAKLSWKGGIGVGGGVGFAHSFIITDICSNVVIDAKCNGFEDIGVQLKRTYKSQGNVETDDCTSPGGAVGNSGYGIAFYDATRYADFYVVGRRWRGFASTGY